MTILDRLDQLNEKCSFCHQKTVVMDHWFIQATKDGKRDRPRYQEICRNCGARGPVRSSREAAKEQIGHSVAVGD